MKVLKFGGTSVANAKNISQVKDIVDQTPGNRLIIVVSAFGGITDLLLKTAELAASQDKGYGEILKEIDSRHIRTVQELIPIASQSKVLSKVKSELNILETLLEGAYLIGETTPKLSDKIVSFGELLSSYIISEFFISSGLDALYMDSRELIKTNNNYGKAVVNFEITNPNCQTYFSQ